LTGRVRARDQASLAFRVEGRVLERPVNVGDVLQAGQLVARLDPQDQQNALRAAQARLAAAEATLTQTRLAFGRQQELLKDGWTPRARFDDAQQAYLSAQAGVTAAQAQVSLAQDLLGYTALYADVPGAVTAKGAEPGEVVRAGQMIVRLARQDGRDAVFDVPAQVIRTAMADPEIQVALTEDPRIKAVGRVREVGAQADPATRTFEVKVGLSDPPPEMRLGATVTGRMEVDEGEIISLPASAVTRQGAEPAVWVVDPASATVALRNIEVARHHPASVMVARGLAPGDIIVTAGVQALRPGQKVRLLGAES